MLIKFISFLPKWNDTLILTKARVFIQLRSDWIIQHGSGWKIFSLS